MTAHSIYIAPSLQEDISFPLFFIYTQMYKAFLGCVIDHVIYTEQESGIKLKHKPAGHNTNVPYTSNLKAHMYLRVNILKITIETKSVHVYCVSFGCPLVHILFNDVYITLQVLRKIASQLVDYSVGKTLPCLFQNRLEYFTLDVVGKLFPRVAPKRIDQ